MAEVIHGDSWNDNLGVEENRTQVYGLAGDDTLSSSLWSEVSLIGGSGNDILNITGGTGTLSGGAGSDIFNLTYSASKSLSVVIEDADPYADRIIVTREDGTPNLAYMLNGNDVIWYDTQGNFSLTLKASTDASDYFDGTASENVWEILEEVNEEREDYGLRPMILSQALTDAAQIRSGEIVSTFSHNRPDGSSCFTALTKTYWRSGENIAAGQVSPDDVMDSWMNSEGHRANILTDDFTKLGVGYTYQNNSTYEHYWVQMFGAGLTEPTTRTTDELLAVSMDTGTNVYSNPYVYTGGNQVISNYTGAPIILGAFPTGLSFIDDDFYFYSSTGTLILDDVEDKLIDFRDGYGNEFAKAYAADDPATIDGRNWTGFEYLVGSDEGSNLIFAGNYNSYLWGNTGWGSDVLIGGYGNDTFFVGKWEGNDSIQNASAADSVNLYDVTLSDISLTAEDNGVIGLAFNTGNVITIQSTDSVSARINLADGSSFQYNHATKSWQGA